MNMIRRKSEARALGGRGIPRPGSPALRALHGMGPRSTRIGEARGRRIALRVVCGIAFVAWSFVAAGLARADTVVPMTAAPATIEWGSTPHMLQAIFIALCALAMQGGIKAGQQR